MTTGQRGYNLTNKTLHTSTSNKIKSIQWHFLLGDWGKKIITIKTHFKDSRHVYILLSSQILSIRKTRERGIIVGSRTLQGHSNIKKHLLCVSSVLSMLLQNICDVQFLFKFFIMYMFFSFVCVRKEELQLIPLQHLKRLQIRQANVCSSDWTNCCLYHT